MSKKKHSKKGAGIPKKISRGYQLPQETLDIVSKISDIKNVSKNIVIEMAVNELVKKVITDHLTDSVP